MKYLMIEVVLATLVAQGDQELTTVPDMYRENVKKILGIKEPVKATQNTSVTPLKQTVASQPKESANGLAD